jgi:ubiquinone/menaquinone biosynthesis C-methylase UbiE
VGRAYTGTKPPSAVILLRRRFAPSARLPAPLCPAGAGTGRPASVGRFDGWAASYDCSQLQSVLYGPVHDAVLRYARRHVQRPGQILDVGCGTGRLSVRLLSGYRDARVVGVDASVGMIRNARVAVVTDRAHFAVAAAEQLPFADAAFDLVVVTLSVSHWADKAAGLAEIGRVMAPGATLVAADISPVWRFHPLIATVRQRRAGGLTSLITACGFRVEHVEPIRSVALIADAGLVAARASTGPLKARTSRGTAAARLQHARASQQ